ncbi:hypothetical protein CRUP_019872 [Coryphaenoides rupestris]|nr:hypothetical protein CRUP_019872 [Coryphaenoides rupestris]
MPLANIPLSPETAQDQERRIRREIANSNERRRMQSINAGFQSLKSLLAHTDGEKLSKAAILQQTSDYIFALEQEKTSSCSRTTSSNASSSPRGYRHDDRSLEALSWVGIYLNDEGPIPEQHNGGLETTNQEEPSVPQFKKSEKDVIGALQDVYPGVRIPSQPHATHAPTRLAGETDETSDAVLLLPPLLVGK